MSIRKIELLTFKYFIRTALKNESNQCNQEFTSISFNSFETVFFIYSYCLHLQWEWDHSEEIQFFDYYLY